MEQEDQVATEQAEGRAASEGRAPSRRSVLFFGGVAVAGAALGVTIAEWRRDGGNNSTALLEAVPPDGLAQIRSTLSPANAAALLNDAQRCQEPLARVLIAQAPGAAGGVVSIVSGGYRSPAFTLTATPTSVGLPFPAPYQAGKGVLVVEGQANGLVIALTPQKILSFTGSSVIPVQWVPVSNCR